jgi:hypothetical protein
MTQDRSALAEHLKRRRDLLEKVLEMMNHFDRVYRHQKALHETLLQTLSPDEMATCQKEFSQLDEELRLAFERFADASGILLMLGETQAEVALEEYREAANSWYEEAVPDPNVTPPARTEQLKRSIADKRSTIMAKLAGAYKGL